MDVTTFLHNFWVRKKREQQQQKPQQHDFAVFQNLNLKRPHSFRPQLKSLYKWTSMRFYQLTTSSPGLFPLKMGEVDQLRDFKWSLRKGGR